MFFQKQMRKNLKAYKTMKNHPEAYTYAHNSCILSFTMFYYCR